MVATLAFAVLSMLVGASASPLLTDVSHPASLFSRTECGIDGPQTCTNITAQANLCCFEAPGGLIDLVQLWDTDVPSSPTDSWTIHGLWSDHCDGTFDASCDNSRNYTSITRVLQENGKQALIDEMTKFWMNQNGMTESFWKNEWYRHGTCMSTINPKCLPAGSPTGADAAAYFQRAVDTFKTLPTFKYFKDSGISPSSTQTYTYDTLANAIKSQWGHTPELDCTRGSSELFQIKYDFNLKGSLIDGTLIPIDAPKKGSCPLTGIKWLPKTVSTPIDTDTPTSSTPIGTDMPTSTTLISTGIPTSTTLIGTDISTSTSVSAGPTSTAVSDRFIISGVTSTGSSVGCLLSAGKWSTQTCAKLTIFGPDTGFVLRSSKGFCAAGSEGIVCGASVSAATVFTSTVSGDKRLLTLSGTTAWTADSVPSGQTQITVFPGSDRDQDITLVISPA